MEADDPRAYEPLTGELLRQAQEFLRLCRRREEPGPALRAAWDQFYAICRRILRRLARTRCRGLGAPDREDLVQQAWAQAAARLPDFRDPGDARTLEAWLTTLFLRRRHDLHRHRRRHPTARLSAAAEAALADDRAAGGDAGAARRAEAAAGVEALRARLSAAEFRLLAWFYLEGRSLAAIGAELGVTARVAKYRLQRARHKARRRWPQRFADLPA